MTRRTAILTLASIACNPKPQGESASDGEAASTAEPVTTGTTTVATTEPSSGSSDTAAAPTSSASTGAIESCSWERPEFQDLRFCPAPLEMGTEITGMSQFGPASFKYARFGMFLPCSVCPETDNQSLVLYNEPWTTDTVNPPGDYLKLAPGPDGQIGFHHMNLNMAEITLEFTSIPNREETSPPLDESSPPVLYGTMTLKSDGWDLAGTFAATLCTDLNWYPSCE